MKIIGIILAVVGVVGMFLSTIMFGDIGLAAGIGSIGCLLSGIGFIKLNKIIITIQNNQKNQTNI